MALSNLETPEKSSLEITSVGFLHFNGELVLGGYKFFHVSADGVALEVAYISCDKNLEIFKFREVVGGGEIQLTQNEALEVFGVGRSCFRESNLRLEEKIEKTKNRKFEEERIKNYEEFISKNPLRYGKSDNWIKCVIESEVKALRQLEENQEKSEAELQKEVREKLLMLYPHLRKRKMFKEA